MSVDLKAAARRLRAIELEEFGGNAVMSDSWSNALYEVNQQRKNLQHALVEAAQGNRPESLARARDAADTAALMLLALAEQLR